MAEGKKSELWKYQLPATWGRVSWPSGTDVKTLPTAFPRIPPDPPTMTGLRMNTVQPARHPAIKN